MREYRIPLFTKFAIVKLKINLFRVSMIFLKSALRWKVSVPVKKALSTKFKSMKLKADACSLFLILISKNQ